jgi:DNA-binding Xre family transcriptional regulator
MKQEVYLPVNQKTIKSLMRKKGLTYSAIENDSNEVLTETRLKYVLNKGKQITLNELSLLAAHLDCELNDLVEPSFLLSMNISSENNRLVSKLYSRCKDVLPRYGEEMKKFRDESDLAGMLNITAHLFLILTKQDIYFEKEEPIKKALEIIKSSLKDNTLITGSEFTGLKKDIQENIYKDIISLKDKYTPHHAMMIFLFVFIIFDAVFIEECVASTVQRIPQRKTDFFQQFCNLTNRIEKMRDTLIEKIVFVGEMFEDPKILELESDDTLIDGIILMLASCEKCRIHIDGFYTFSEEVNHASLSAIIRKLENIFDELEIEMPKDDPSKILTSRFSGKYAKLKTIFNMMNPPSTPKNQMLIGYILGKYNK